LVPYAAIEGEEVLKDSKWKKMRVYIRKQEENKGKR
jgi:hypothetical protein